MVCLHFTPQGLLKPLTPHLLTLAVFPHPVPLPKKKYY